MTAELFQVVLWLGRGYLVVMFFYGTYLLYRLRLWALHLLFIVGAAAYIGYSILAALGQTPAATPYRLLGLYGIALCVHVLLLVLHTLIRRHSVQRLQPLGHHG